MIHDEAGITTDVVNLDVIDENCLRALTDPSLDHGQAVQSSARAASQGGKRLRSYFVLIIADFCCLSQQAQSYEAQHDFDHVFHI